MQSENLNNETIHLWGFLMAQKLGNSELVSFKELLMANSIQVDALAQLMIRKGFITKEEFFDMLKVVQAEYKSRTDD
jgi:hypothetical protein